MSPLKARGTKKADVTLSPAAAKEIRLDASVVVLSELKAFLGGKDFFCFTLT